MIDIPVARPFRLVRARVPTGTFVISEPGPAAETDSEEVALLDIDVGPGGGITRVMPSGSQALPADWVPLDVKGRQVWPGLVESHAHIDKSHTWRRAPNPDGTLRAARDAVKADRLPQWAIGDVARRMDFTLRCAYAHGTVALRTHLDSQEGRSQPTWTAIAALRREWEDRIRLQPVATLGLTKLHGDWGEHVARLAAEQGGILGPVVYDEPDLPEHLARAFDLATRYHLDLDFHVDETSDPHADGLTKIAEMALETGFSGRVQCGHACSLAKRTDEQAAYTVARVREAGIGIVALPLTNLFLQDRVAGRTPRWRGMTLVRELKAAGVRVALGGDNVRDAFHRFGDNDMIDVFREAVRVGHLDLPIGAWPSAVSTLAADIIGVPDLAKIAAGFPADLILFPARDYSELLARGGAGRRILRNGRLIAATLPDFEELDGTDT